MKIKDQTEDNFNKLSSFLKGVYKDPEEKAEASRKVEEIIALSVLGDVLDQLPPDTHEEFMEIITGESDEGRLAKYLKDKKINIEGKLLETSQELMHDIVDSSKEIKIENQAEGKPPIK